MEIKGCHAFVAALSADDATVTTTPTKTAVAIIC
jgi:hypothetical protein